MSVIKDDIMREALIFFIGYLLGGIMFDFWQPDREFMPFRYDSLEDDYVDCMSWHKGAGYVIINVDKKGKQTYNLTCEDGHKPTDHKHPYMKRSPLVRGE